MLKTPFCITLGFLLAIGPQFIWAQTMVNPDISLIGDVRLSVHNNDESNPERAEKPILDFHELEIAATGYLNPFARADIFLGIHGVEGPIEVEEAYMTLLRGLPLGLQMKAGQYLADFGRLNTQHPHQWSWMERPLMFQEIFGEDGLKDVGLGLSCLVPLGNTAWVVSATMLKTGGLSTHHHHHAEDGDGDEHEVTQPDMAALSRVSAFVPLGETTFLETGASLLRGEHEPAENRYATLANFDFKLKWRPDIYRSLTLVGEILSNFRTVRAGESHEDSASLHGETSDVRSFGTFSAVDYQFRRRWNVGAFHDYTQGAEDENVYHCGYGIFAGFALAEETSRFGFVLRRHEGSDISDPFYSATLQFLWSLGPHKPHPF
ncbi:MAG: hypothetical protein V1784_06875 [bacterium]